MILKRFVLLFAIAACVGAIAVSGVAIWQLASRGADGAGRAAIGGPFQLIDAAGRPVGDADFRGRRMLIHFGYTYCPDVCPTELQAMSVALDRLGGAAEAIQPLFITVDPERDTPALLKGYVPNFGPTFIGLTGTLQQVADVARAFRVYYQKVPGKDGGPYLMDHSSIVYLLDRNGRFVTHFTHEAKADAIAKAVGRLL